jgi:hypothetical protein
MHNRHTRATPVQGMGVHIQDQVKLDSVLEAKARDVGTRILIFFALKPKLVPKTGSLRFGNSKIKGTG